MVMNTVASAHQHGPVAAAWQEGLLLLLQHKDGQGLTNQTV